MNDNELWREAILIEIRRLKIERFKILTLDARLSYQDLIKEEERAAMLAAIEIIDIEIQRLEAELVLDELLSGDIDFENGKLVKRKKDQ